MSPRYSEDAEPVLDEAPLLSPAGEAPRTEAGRTPAKQRLWEYVCDIRGMGDNGELDELMDAIEREAATPPEPDPDRGHVHRHPTGSPFYHDECDITDRAESGTALPLDVDACDGSMLERAIRNTRREQLAKGWTGNLTDGWTIAAEYNRLLAEDRRLSESGSPPAIDRSKSGRILSIGGESGSPTPRTPHFWSDDDERTPGPTPPGAEPRDVD